MSTRRKSKKIECFRCGCYFVQSKPNYYLCQDCYEKDSGESIKKKPKRLIDNCCEYSDGMFQDEIDTDEHNDWGDRDEQ